MLTTMRIEPSTAVGIPAKTNPVKPVHDAAPASTSARHRPTQHSSSEPKRELHPNQDPPRRDDQHQWPDPAKDEVKVHYDEEGKNLVSQFFDSSSGELVREVPSEQVRSVVHAIEKQFERAVSSHKTEQLSASVNTERGTHGHQS
jgi:uncharacterized FlaG/YvyC family protein